MQYIDAIIQALKLDRAEEFEQGCDLFAKHLDDDAKAYKDRLINLDTPKLQLQKQQRYLLFFYLYFYVRNKIENSYDYMVAFHIYSSMDRFASDDLLFSLIYRYFFIPISFTRIDRGIYNSDEKLLQTVLQQIQTAVDEVKQAAASFEDTDLCDSQDQKLINTYIQEGVTNYSRYVEATGIIINLYTLRWQKKSLQEAFSRDQKRLETLKESLENVAGFDIFASEIRSHIEVLKQFLQLPPTQMIKIKDGNLSIQYYATLKKQSDLAKELEDLGFEASALADVWDVMHKSQNLKMYHKDYDSFKIYYKQQEYTIDLQVKFNTLGVFTVEFTISLNGVSMDSYRFLQNLGMPFSLDERFIFQSYSEYTTLRQIAEQTFEAICQQIDVDDILYDCETNLHTITTINAFENCDITTFKNSIFYKAVSVYPYEVRTSIDDWICKQNLLDRSKINIHGLNSDEIYATSPYITTLALTQHPNWVALQEKDSIEVAATVLNYLDLLKGALYSELEEIGKIDYDQESIDIKQMLFESEIKSRRLIAIEKKLIDFIELIENGSYLVYPDHTKRMQTIFEDMGFERKKEELKAIMKRLSFENNTIQNKIEQIDKKIKGQKQAKINFIIEVAMTMLSVAALIDIFRIIEEVAAHFEIGEGLSIHILSEQGLFWDVGKLIVIICMIFFLFFLLKSQKKYEK